MVDSTSLVYYHHEDIAGWNEWVDEHYRLGRRVYMLHFAAEQVIRDWAEFGLSIPECFQILKYEPKLSEGKLQKVLNDLVSAMEINCDNTYWRTGALQLDLQGVSVAGYVFDHADPSQFSEADRSSTGVVYMSSKSLFCCQFLSSARHREIFNAVIRDNGLGRLIPCRWIDKNCRGRWKDMF